MLAVVFLRGGVSCWWWVLFFGGGRGGGGGGGVKQRLPKAEDAYRQNPGHHVVVCAACHALGGPVQHMIASLDDKLPATAPELVRGMLPQPLDDPASAVGLKVIRIRLRKHRKSTRPSARHLAVTRTSVCVKECGQLLGPALLPPKTLAGD